LLSDIILFMLGEHNDTISGEAELNWHRVRSDLELEISMLGHLLKNICEPYVICNKKRRSHLIDRSVIFHLVKVTFVADTVSLKLR